MKIYHKIEGSPNSPVLVLSNSLGTDIGMWDRVVPLLLPYFRIVRYDTRGQGASEVSPGPYSIAQLGKDVIDLMESLDIQKFYFCGISLGGLIGQWLGCNHPEKLQMLILSNTAPKIGTQNTWNDRIQTIAQSGMSSIWPNTQKVWFTDEFLRNEPAIMAALGYTFLKNNVHGYSHCCAAVRDADFTNELSNIPTKTLVIAGAEDLVTSEKDAILLASEIPNATMITLESKHIPAIEKPFEFANAIVAFSIGETNALKGKHLRRSVLGNAHVDDADKNKNSFNADFQEFIEKYAWGEIWSRPDLNKHQRSLITLAMLIALNRKAEFKMHVKAALHNGVGVKEIKEVIMHAGIYCGLPAANEALHSALEVFHELSIELDEEN